LIVEALRRFVKIIIVILDVPLQITTQAVVPGQREDKQEVATQEEHREGSRVVIHPEETLPGAQGKQEIQHPATG
jgi:hypothetical protein